jgi:localization factor PodJL
MTKLATRLEERVQDSESRSARAIEQVGEQVAGVAQRIQSRQEQSMREISERLDASEQRQEARLSDVLSNVSERFERLREEADSKVSPVQRAIASLASRLDTIEHGKEPAASPLEELPNAEDAAPAALQGGDEEAFEPGLPDWEAVSDDDYAPGSASDAPEAARPGEADFDELDFLEDGDGETRDSDIFDDAFEERDEVYSGDESGPHTAAERQPPAPRLVEDTDASDYIARARAAAIAAASDGGRAGAGEKPARQRSGPGRLPLYAAASVIVVAAAGAGYLTLRGKQPAEQTRVQAEADGVSPPGAEPSGQIASLQPRSERKAKSAPEEPFSLDDGAPFTTAGEDDLFDPEPVANNRADGKSGDEVEPSSTPSASASGADSDSPQRAPATGPVGFDPIPQKPSLEQAAEAGDRLAQFQLGRDRLDAGDFAMGASLVRKSAEQGLAAAQYRLGKLHEKGLGVARDLSEARRWTEMAAKGGNIKAMHDFAVYLAEGEGGPQSYAGAVEWFGKASQYGVVDSQYNLGVLYEQGLGISPDPAEALFWFSVADRQGDPGADEMIQSLRSRVSLDEARNAERRAASWNAKTPDPISNGDISSRAWADSSAPRVTAVQVALNALGFEAGPADGVIGPSTRDAIRRFQEAKGLSVTGNIDKPLVRTLNAKARRPDG